MTDFCLAVRAHRSTRDFWPDRLLTSDPPEVPQAEREHMIEQYLEAEAAKPRFTLDDDLPF